MTNEDYNDEKGAGRASWWTRYRRWLIGLIAVSLALNLFVAGWAGVRWAAWEWGMHKFGDVLSHHDRGRDHGRKYPEIELLRELVQDHGAAGLSIAAAGIPALRETADALEQDPFDPARLDTALATLETVGQEFLVHAGIVARDGVSRLDTEQRQKIARRIHRSAERMESRIDRWEDRFLGQEE